MFLQITPDAQKKLQPYLDDGRCTLLLDFADGAGPFAKDETSCSLDINFNLLIVAKDTDLTSYKAGLKTNLGTILTKEYALNFLDKQNELTVNESGILQLKGSHNGLIDNNVRLINYLKI